MYFFKSYFLKYDLIDVGNIPKESYVLTCVFHVNCSHIPIRRVPSLSVEFFPYP
jgi:hypothetical protein